MSEREIVEWLYTNAQQGNWRVLLAGVLSAVVWFLRVGIMRPGIDRVPVLGKFSKWFKTDRGGVVLTALVGVCGGIATALFSSHKVDTKLVVSGLINAALAAGVFNVFKRGFAPSDKAETPPAPPTPKRKKAVRIPLVPVAILFFLLPGCAAGEFMFRYDQATATAATGALACKDTLSDTNDSMLAACGALRIQHDLDGAQACLDKWKKTYGVADSVCKALKVEAQAAQASREIVAAAANGNKDAAAWIARLAVAGAKVVQVFLDSGIKLGGK